MTHYSDGDQGIINEENMLAALGDPAQTYTFEDYRVFVYDYDISTRLEYNKQRMGDGQ